MIMNQFYTIYLCNGMVKNRLHCKGLIFSFIFISLECPENYWGELCNIQSEKIEIDQEHLTTIIEDQSIYVIYFETNDSEYVEIDFISWFSSQNQENLCMAYQIGSPILSYQIESLNQNQFICSKQDQNSLSYKIHSYNKGFHYFTFFNFDDNTKFKVSLLSHQNRTFFISFFNTF